MLTDQSAFFFDGQARADLLDADPLPGDDLAITTCTAAAVFEQCCEISVDSRGRVIECQSRALDQIPEDCRAAAASWSARHGARGSDSSESTQDLPVRKT